MALNIKNPEAHKMAKEMAEKTGESMTEAVTEAIRERRDRVMGKSKEERRQAILKIGRECAEILAKSDANLDHGDLLYDEDGLPK